MSDHVPKFLVDGSPLAELRGRDTELCADRDSVVAVAEYDAAKRWRSDKGVDDRSPLFFRVHGSEFCGDSPNMQDAVGVKVVGRDRISDV
jgi:hypothetical protein